MATHSPVTRKQRKFGFDTNHRGALNGVFGKGTPRDTHSADARAEEALIAVAGAAGVVVAAGALLAVDSRNSARALGEEARGALLAVDANVVAVAEAVALARADAQRVARRRGQAVCRQHKRKRATAA